MYRQQPCGPQVFSRLLPDTPPKYLGLYNDADAANSREAALRNHLIDFLVTRSRSFKDAIPADYSKRHPPIVRPTSALAPKADLSAA